MGKKSEKAYACVYIYIYIYTCKILQESQQTFWPTLYNKHSVWRIPVTS